MPFPSLKKIIQLLSNALHELRMNDPLRLAAATAFFTTFALPAILIIFIQLFGLISNPQKLSEHLFDHLAVMLGKESTRQVQQILLGFKQMANNWYITIGGFVFLLFVATTLFSVLRNSLNQLWNIKVHHHAGFVFQLKLRIKSFAVIIFTGVLFIAHLFAEGIQILLRDYINELWSGSGSFLYLILSQVLSILIVTAWFTALFKYLANGHPSWNIALAGGLFTGVLFTAGKLILAWLLTYSNIRTIYGASGSFVLMLLFVFYCSFILYYGGMFTKLWAKYNNKAFELDKHAYEFKISEIEIAGDAS